MGLEEGFTHVRDTAGVQHLLGGAGSCSFLTRELLPGASPVCQPQRSEETAVEEHDWS